MVVQFRQTKVCKKIDDVIKSFTEPKAKQRTFETSEDNVLLDLVYRPINTNAYSSSREQKGSMIRSEPTQTVVQMPLEKHSSEKDISDKEMEILFHRNDKEFDRYDDIDYEKYADEKKQSAQDHEESKL